MPRGRPKKKIADMQQIDGKLHETIKPRTLDEIMGIQESIRYSTSDTLEYENALREMNRTDLWREAQRNGLVPTHDVVRLRKTLVAEHTRYFRTRSQGGQERIQANSEDFSEEVKKIMSEGR